MERLKKLKCVFTLWSDSDVDVLCSRSQDTEQDTESNTPQTNAIYPFIENLDGESLKKICKQYQYPISIVYEKRYVDKLYRDIYYHYYSEMHFDVSRQCQRLALFRLPETRGHRPYTEADFIYGTESANEKRNLAELDENFIGVIVVRPPFVQVPANDVKHTMSRTLLSVKHGHSKDDKILSAQYRIAIYGHTYTVSAFPFSNQHGDALKCAETCIWEMLEYYGTRYSNYRTVLPSDIYKKISTTASQRFLPSIGLNINESSYLLQSFGFETKLYLRELFDNVDANVESVRHYKEPGKIKCRTAVPYFHRIFHYCVESGFPLYCVLDTPTENNSPRHSVLTIGYVEINTNQLSTGEIEKSVFKWADLFFLDLADISYTYIVNDDNQVPYLHEDFDSFSSQSEQKNHRLNAFVVPLPRHVYLDADMAASYIDTLLYNYCDLLSIAINELELGNSQSNPIVIRYFLTTVKNFKEQRITDAVICGQDKDNEEEIIFYSNLDYSHFIWVAEFSTVELYNEDNYIFGELVLDATASSSTAHASVIAIRIGPNAAYRLQDESSMAIFDQSQTAKSGRITGMRVIYHRFCTHAS